MNSEIQPCASMIQTTLKIKQKKNDGNEDAEADEIGTDDAFLLANQKEIGYLK